MSREESIRALVAELGEVRDDGTLDLDSFGIIDLVEQLEDRFGIRVASREVTRERFSTLAALVAFVEEKTA